MQELEGRVAVVTGAASGIGRALAERFAREGMRLALADVESGPLEEVAALLRERGAEVLALETDVADGAAVERLAARTRERFGTWHLVCNNAGVGAGGPLWTLSEEEWRWVVGVNLWGVIHGVRTFVPRLVEQDEGHVVNTASVAGLLCPTGMGIYNTTKHAVVALSETLYGDLRLAGSRVGASVLCPGFVRTRIFESDRHRPADAPAREVPDEAERARRVEAFHAIAMPPEEVAEAVVRAVREDRFWILTHPEALPAVEARTRRILRGRNPEPRLPEGPTAS